MSTFHSAFTLSICGLEKGTLVHISESDDTGSETLPNKKFPVRFSRKSISSWERRSRAPTDYDTAIISAIMKKLDLLLFLGHPVHIRIRRRKQRITLPRPEAECQSKKEKS